MKFSSRRNFIKKHIFGGLLFAAGAPLASLANIDNSVAKRSISMHDHGGNIDWKAVRKEFLIQEKRHYFNTGSLGPSPRAVVDKVCDMTRHLAEIAHSGHSATRIPHEKIAAFLNTTPEEIAITRNATEGMNIAARSLPLHAGDEVLITNHEHIGGAAPWVALQKDKGIVVKLIELDLEGKDNLQRIKDSITEKTKAISFSHVTYNTGLRLPAKEIVDLCREKGIYSCIDGAQAMGMIALDLQALNPDFYIGSGHKWLFGPKGTGVLFINKSVIRKCTPTFAGAYTDEKFDLNALILEYRCIAQREEYGTRNAPTIIGLGAAIDFITDIGIEHVEQRGSMLAEYFRAGAEQIPKISILSPKDPQYASSIISFAIADTDLPTVSKKLDKGKGLRVRTIFENGMDGLRVSCAIFNSKEEVDYLLDSLGEILAE